MQVETSRFEALIRKTSYIREELRTTYLSGDDTYTSIDRLHEVVQRMYGLTIERKEVAVSTVHVLSMVRRYADSRAQIAVKNNLAEPERRFAVAKEFLHLALDEREDWSTEAANTISEIIELDRMETRGHLTHIPSAAVVCEHLAEVAAVEVLYPFEVRGSVNALIDDGMSPDFATIALQFKIPVRAVKLAHQEDLRACLEEFRGMPTV